MSNKTKKTFQKINIFGYPKVNIEKMMSFQKKNLKLSKFMSRLVLKKQKNSRHYKIEKKNIFGATNFLLYLGLL